MRKRKLQYSRLIVLGLVVAITATALCVTTFAVQGNISNIAESNDQSSQTQIGDNIQNIQPSINNAPVTQTASTSLPNNNSNETKYIDQRAVDKNNSNSGKDIYTYSKSDLEELVKQGYSIKNIYEADKVGNSILVNPKTILKRSKDENKDVEGVKQEIISERQTNVLRTLQSKYPNEYNQMVQQQLDDNQKRRLLEFIDRNDVKSVDTLISDYKVNGDQALTKYKNLKTNTVSQDNINKYNLTQDDVKFLNDNTIKNIENVSQKTGIPVKDIIAKMQNKGAAN